MKKVSVIIPAYNSEKFISETLENMIRQSLDDIEIIVVNDGSKDNTVSIVEEYQKRYANIVLINQENAGVSNARNNGLSVATGEYVLFHDADDLISDTTLEAYYIRAKQTGADILIGRIRNFSGDEYSKYNPVADKLASMDYIDNYDETLLWNFLVGNKFYKRDRLVSSGITFPPYRYSEEGAFFMSYVYTGAKISGCFGGEAYYRRHIQSEGLSVSQTVTKSLAMSFCDSLNMIYQRAESATQNLSKEARNEYLNEILYKKAFVLISQFYRPLWQGDDDCLSYVSEEITNIFNQLDDKRKSKLRSDNFDLFIESLPGTKKDIENITGFTVVIKSSVKEPSKLIYDLYNQFSPYFSVIIPESLVSEIDDSYLKMSNIMIIPNKNFMKTAKTKAKGIIVIFRKSVNLDVRTFRLVYKLKGILPEKIVNLFFSAFAKLINFVLTKKIIK